MNLKKKLLNSNNWNVGFTNDSPESLIANKGISNISWMKHSFRDRFFADPFILNVTNDEIRVLAEELKFEYPKGHLVELIVDKKTKRLIERYVILELDTHLSYPAIIRENSRIYVYPENGQSGFLYVYEYNDQKHRLEQGRVLAPAALADATIFNWENKLYMVATQYPRTQEAAYLLSANNLCEQFYFQTESPICSDKRYARPAGDFFKVGNHLFRPAQDCRLHYGSAISIMEVHFNGQNYSEEFVFKILPPTRKYNLGIHTINFFNGVCVIDSYGYAYPIMAKCIISLVRLKNQILH